MIKALAQKNLLSATTVGSKDYFQGGVGTAAEHNFLIDFIN
jgi:hypothetical protein